jgi:hypothetical protein
VSPIAKGTVGALLVAALLAGCGGGGLSRAGPGDLSHGGVSIFVPDQWYGRILFADAQGVVSIFQVANFRLADQEGFAPPKELPAGHEDPIKAMSGDDVLVEVETDGPADAPTRPLPIEIGRDSLVTTDSLRLPVPGDHAVGRKTACVDDRCLVITVDFASHPVSDRVLQAANAVLASLRVSP